MSESTRRQEDSGSAYVFQKHRRPGITDNKMNIDFFLLPLVVTVDIEKKPGHNSRTKREERNIKGKYPLVLSASTTI